MPPVAATYRRCSRHSLAGTSCNCRRKKVVVAEKSSATTGNSFYSQKYLPETVAAATAVVRGKFLPPLGIVPKIVCRSLMQRELNYRHSLRVDCARHVRNGC